MNTQKFRVEKKNYLKIALPTILSILLFSLVIFTFLFPSMQQHMMDSKKEMLKEMVNMAIHELERLNFQVIRGECSIQDAQEKAKEFLRRIRYGADRKDYFWINDTSGRMVMHPYRLDLEGKNVIDLTDPNGKHLVREFIKVVESKGEGFVDYMWQWKDDPYRLEPKLSFVKRFEPWNWIIGTGIYVDDVMAEISSMSRKLFFICVGVLAIVTVLLAFVIVEGISFEKKRLEALNSLHESQERFRRLAEDAPFAISIMKGDGTFEYVNQRFTEIFGYTLEDVPDKETWFQKAYPDPGYREEVRNAWKKDKASHPMQNQIKERIFQVTCKDGTRKLIRFRYVALQNDRHLLTYEDVTEMIRAEEKLKESEARYKELYEKAQRAQQLYKSLLESSVDAVVIYDLEGRVVYLNPAFEKIFGWRLEELKGKRIPFVPESEQVATHAKISEIIEKGFPCQEFETKRMTKDGRVLDVSISASLYKDHTGKPAGMLVQLRDITERKRLQTQLQQAQKMEAIGTLAGGIAHDFNNLLMGIQGTISVMLLEIDPQHPWYKKLQVIEEQIQSGAKLTGQLLGYARRGKYEVKPIDVNEVVRETAETFGRTKKEIEIHLDLAPDLLPVEGDRAQLEQVLFNLYINAWQAMTSGGDLYIATRNISHEELGGRVYKPKRGNYVMISVRDTGVGMDKEIQERIFEPFFTTKEMGHGTGLGLASAYGIVKGHGGYIDVESEKGKGSTFKIYLPASKRSLDHSPIASSIIRKGKGTVLLVDDEEHIVKVGKDLLSALGYEVMVARSGEEALEIYRKNSDKIDVVLLDMVMPRMGGREVFERLRRLNPQVKVLLSSGYSLEGEAQEIMNQGCDGFIQKPYRAKDLMKALEKVLERS